MIIEHKYRDKKVVGQVSEEVGFLISNKKGGFFSQGISSIYSGLYFKQDTDFFKTIEEIRINKPIKKIKNNFWNVERIRDGIKEEYFMPIGENILAAELNKKEKLQFLLDIKKPYDDRDWGRTYEVSEEKGVIVIKFVKKTDNREDTSHEKIEFVGYLCIATQGELRYHMINEWEKKKYEFDKNRGISKHERHVFKAVELEAKRLVISFSLNKSECISKAKKSLKNFSKLRNKTKITKYDGKNIELVCAKSAMEKLIDTEAGDIYAGLPWFYQFWSRDSLVSLKAVMMEHKQFAKKLITKYLDNISKNGLLPNRIPGTSTNSADSIGWFAKRIQDYQIIFNEEINITNIQTSTDILFKETTKDSIVFNKAQETWMDSIERSGFRIEIQALRIVLYDLLYKKTKSKVYVQLRDKTISKTREVFFKDRVLIDGKDDKTIRPNLFIAAYLYPDLLSSKEWIKCFDVALSKLWLEWGGVATIDINSTEFCSKSTGQDPMSYHNGDSWYWLNNLVGIVLSQFDKKKFKPYIDKIYEASKNEILFKGYAGCHCEISSAFKQESAGCLNQAWSNALFIEFANLKD